MNTSLPSIEDNTSPDLLHCSYTDEYEPELRNKEDDESSREVACYRIGFIARTNISQEFRVQTTTLTTVLLSSNELNEKASFVSEKLPRPVYSQKALNLKQESRFPISFIVSWL
ncbi:hypothetical protein Bpfe_024268 [Biomphalaria pfeifferi]|uniref:Uncharacterized protein n=1 Tax=Biomphalaria pfeifferi TaxID=112525 RepID=A0AAD8F0Y6_BIOPF|nr:hypothetical protein Bpfe_024268 [Biomphalaria pfeifferi]